MFNLFKKNETDEGNNLSLIAITALLIHSAKIDENFTDKEKEIIKKALIEMGAQTNEVDVIVESVELESSEDVVEAEAVVAEVVVEEKSDSKDIVEAEAVVAEVVDEKED